MNKPNKIYSLTIVYNDDTEEVEYLQESIEVDDMGTLEKSSVLMAFSDYWDDDTLSLLKDVYYLAEA